MDNLLKDNLPDADGAVPMESHPERVSVCKKSCSEQAVAIQEVERSLDCSNAGEFDRVRCVDQAITVTREHPPMPGKGLEQQVSVQRGHLANAASGDPLNLARRLNGIVHMFQHMKAKGDIECIVAKWKSL